MERSWEDTLLRMLFRELLGGSEAILKAAVDCSGQSVSLIITSALCICYSCDVILSWTRGSYQKRPWFWLQNAQPFSIKPASKAPTSLPCRCLLNALPTYSVPFSSHGSSCGCNSFRAGFWVVQKVQSHRGQCQVPPLCTRISHPSPFQPGCRLFHLLFILGRALAPRWEEGKAEK